MISSKINDYRESVYSKTSNESYEVRSSSNKAIVPINFNKICQVRKSRKSKFASSDDRRSKPKENENKAFDKKKYTFSPQNFLINIQKRDIEAKRTLNSNTSSIKDQNPISNDFDKDKYSLL